MLIVSIFYTFDLFFFKRRDFFFKLNDQLSQFFFAHFTNVGKTDLIRLSDTLEYLFIILPSLRDKQC